MSLKTEKFSPSPPRGRTTKKQKKRAESAQHNSAPPHRENAQYSSAALITSDSDAARSCISARVFAFRARERTLLRSSSLIAAKFCIARLSSTIAATKPMGNSLFCMAWYFPFSCVFGHAPRRFVSLRFSRCGLYPASIVSPLFHPIRGKIWNSPVVCDTRGWFFRHWCSFR